ncbi:MAG: glutamine--fructose-6-phosphate transaminase (isomerizing) [Sphingomonadales bacterium]|tara:strand:- start:3850 stop:5676 length:1827 start_codon:yes stop_codon:yes gene_type:complete
MCGIVGIVSNRDVTERIIGCLEDLEYRGYDGAGIATITTSLDLTRRRARGKLINLKNEIVTNPISGNIGIGHTRWATHGKPSVINAHPHLSDKVAVVHNGIIENFQYLRHKLINKGHVFNTDTDTETIVHLITDYINSGLCPKAASREAINELEGAFALAIIFEGEENLMIGARQGSPLVLGYGTGEMFLGSDAISISSLTNKLVYLEEGDRVEITNNSSKIFDYKAVEVVREIIIIDKQLSTKDKGAFNHYMIKEIYDQPAVVGQTLRSLINSVKGCVELGNLPFNLTEVTRVTIVACGTSFYAAMVAKYWFEKIARVTVDVDIASEFRYREPVMTPGGLSIFISQSGETADTLAALKYAKNHGQSILSIINTVQSSMERESDFVLHTHAGPEIGVASTKSFTCQLAVLACVVISYARLCGKIDDIKEESLCNALLEAPGAMVNVLSHDDKIKKMALKIAEARDVIYLGRGLEYPIAMEGALKLKEISYIHAEGYAAGEMKHGPIALVDHKVPIIVIAPTNKLYEKTVSNMHEVIARNGQVYFFTDQKGLNKDGESAIETIALPDMDEFVTPILYALPVQLLSYHVAVAKGTDVDQPRNLAKSVTVE